MEHIPGYDGWKTTPPDAEADVVCSICGCDLDEGDGVYEINGEIWCEDCMKNEFRRIL